LILAARGGDGKTAAHFLLPAHHVRALRILSLLALVGAASRADAALVADDVSVATATDAPALVTLRATHGLDLPLGFSVARQPSRGTLGPMDIPECTFSPGLTVCTATVLYTPDPTEAGTDDFTYVASDGNADSNVATVTVTIAAPEPIMPPAVTLAMGDVLLATASKVVTGATVDWGDGTPAEGLTVNPDRSAALAHRYALEGSFTLTVTNAPGIIGTSLVHVFIPGAGPTATDTVAPGEEGTVSLPGLTATLHRSPAGSDPATILAALYSPTLEGFFVGGAFGEPVAAFDVRVVSAADDDVATVAFSYRELPERSQPVLTYLAPETHTFEPVAGSALVSPSLTIDSAARIITVVLDRTSSPSVTRLTGTRLVVPDPFVPRVVDIGPPMTSRAGLGVRVHTGQATLCPAHGRPCAVAVRARVALGGTASTLLAPRFVIGKNRLRCGPGKRADVVFPLAARSRRVLERLGQLPVMVAIRARVVGHPSTMVTRTFTVEAP